MSEKRKIVFLDIDGTLTEPGSNEPPISAVEAIKAARQAGHYVFICTGRNYDMLRPLLKYDFDGVIASSGGYVECQGKVIYDCPMTDEQRRTSMDILKENGVFRTVECMDGSYTDEGFKKFLEKNKDTNGNSELLRWRRQIEESLNILPMSEYREQPIYKIVIMSPSFEQLEQPKKVLSNDFNFCIHGVDKYGIVNGEVVNTKFDKGKAVERVSEYLNIPLSDTIAFGDSMNDKEMMEKAGTSICMANGSEELKKISDDICPSVSEDGLSVAFKKYNLI
jgi:Cof subfamily protein (haloacid dehalogenase superfamily)